MRAGLITDTYLEAMVRGHSFLLPRLLGAGWHRFISCAISLRVPQEIIKHKLSYDEFEEDEDINQRIDEAADEPDIYGRLARSIAPEIFGTFVRLVACRSGVGKYL